LLDLGIHSTFNLYNNANCLPFSALLAFHQETSERPHNHDSQLRTSPNLRALSSPEHNPRHLRLQRQLIAHLIRNMCLEIFKRFRCGCEEYKDVELCRYLDEANDLIDNRGLGEDDPKIDKLYEKCDGVGAKRYEAQFTKCAECLAATAAAAAAAGESTQEKFTVAELRDADGSAGSGPPSQAPKRKR
jgi:AhpD family alkylhydroperoxidase